LFDTRRPQGVPWPPKDDKVLYHTALPDRYRKIAPPLGITGAIEVECSPWLDDNQWVLDVAAKDTIVVGTVGNLDPGTPDFRRHLNDCTGIPCFSVFATEICGVETSVRNSASESSFLT
jgi:L-fuconolactonase